MVEPPDAKPTNLETSVAMTRAAFRGSLAYGIIAVAFAALFIWPMLGTAYISDDSINSLLPLRAHFGDPYDYWGAMRDSIVGIAEGTGRIFPVMLFLLFGTFAAFPELGIYKAYLFSLILVDVALLFALVRCWNGSAPLAAFAALVFTVGIQFRNYDDPVLAFHGALPLLIAALCGALIAFTAAARNRSIRLVGVAALLYLFAALIYESTYPLALMFPLVAWRMGVSTKRIVALSAPFFLIAGGLVFATFILRAHVPHGVGETSTTVSFNEFAIVRTFAVQLLGSVPATYAIIDRSGILWNRNEYVVIAVIFGFVAGALSVAYLSQKLGEVDPILTAGCGTMMFLLPAVPIAFAQKYQTYLVAGLAHLNYLLENAGFALCIVALVVSLRRSGRRRAWPILVTAALFVAVASGLTAGANAAVGTLFAYERDDRSLITEALHAGLLRNVPNGSLIMWDSPHGFVCTEDMTCVGGLDFRYFVYDAGGPRVHVVSPAKASLALIGCRAVADCKLSSIPLYVVKEAFLDFHGHGWVFVGRVDKLREMSDGTLNAHTSSLDVFVVTDESRLNLVTSPSPAERRLGTESVLDVRPSAASTIITIRPPGGSWANETSVSL